MMESTMLEVLHVLCSACQLHGEKWHSLTLMSSVTLVYDEMHYFMLSCTTAAVAAAMMPPACRTQQKYCAACVIKGYGGCCCGSCSAHAHARRCSIRSLRPRLAQLLCDMQAKSLLHDHAGFICDICMDSVAVEAMHAIRGCLHEFCKDCLEKHILVHMDSRPLPVPCPAMECDGVMAVDECASLLCSQADIHRLNQLNTEQCCLSESSQEVLHCVIMSLSALTDADEVDQHKQYADKYCSAGVHATSAACVHMVDILSCMKGRGSLLRLIPACEYVQHVLYHLGHVLGC